MPPLPLHLPPDKLPDINPLPWSSDLWRIQNAPGWSARAYPAPRYRFDAPAGEYATVYASADQLAVFAEVYRERGRRLGEEDAERCLARIAPRRPLPLVDLRDPQVLIALDLDERVSVGDDYRACQAWALALFRAIPGACGLCYRSRMAGAMATNVALFGERCAGDVDVVAIGKLRGLEEIVLAAADRYDLTVLFLFG